MTTSSWFGKIWEGVSEPVHHYASWTGVSTEEFPQFVFYVIQHNPCHFLQDCSWFR